MYVCEVTVKGDIVEKCYEMSWNGVFFTRRELLFPIYRCG